MVAVPFAPFDPDKSRFNTGAMPIVTNVVPKIDGYGPLPALLVTGAVYDYLVDENGDYLVNEDGQRLVVGVDWTGITGQLLLPGDCTAYFAARREDGSEAQVAGTSEGLHQFNPIQFVWEDVSGPSAPYDTDAAWSIEKFGSVLYAANGVDYEQKMDIESDTAFSDNSSAPKAKYLRAVGDFMTRGNIVGHPARWQWSAINNPQLNTANSKLSGFQDMPEGDEVMGTVPLSNGAHVIMRSAIQGMILALEPDFVFRRTLIDGKRGTSSPGSICQIGQDDYLVYLDDGWTRFKNGAFTNIGEGRVNQWFLGECDQDERAKIRAALDPEHNCVWIGYTDTNGARKSLGYQYILDQFVLAELQFQVATPARTFAYSESDPPISIVGLWRFSAIDEDGQLAYLVGNNLAAILETNEVRFAPDRAFVNGVRLQSDAQNFTITVSTTDVLGGAFRSRAAVSPSARSGKIPVRADGRTHKIRATIAQGSTWTIANGLDVDVVQSGKA